MTFAEALVMADNVLAFGQPRVEVLLRHRIAEALVAASRDCCQCPVCLDHRLKMSALRLATTA